MTADGPGTVFHQFGAGKMDPGETIVFTAAGTKTVSHVMTLQPTYGNDMGGEAILEAIGADAARKHGIPTQGSNNADFNITCTSGGGKQESLLNLDVFPEIVRGDICRVDRARAIRRDA